MDAKRFRSIGLPYGPKDAERRYWRALGVESGYLATGLSGLDCLLGGKGFPRGAVSIVFGDAMTGKSSLCLRLVAQTQQSGGDCVWMDAESSLSGWLAESSGVDIARLPVVRGMSGDECVQAVRMLVEGGSADLIVIDSMTALDTGLTGSEHYARQREWLVNMAEWVRETKTGVVIVCQTRNLLYRNGVSQSVSSLYEMESLCGLRLEISKGEAGEGLHAEVTLKASGIFHGEWSGRLISG
ncbi:MAG: AAA family ATPase [Bacteroidales bacterium]|nr:AAA family ATPase [Bacteroidales bacterium]